MRSFRAAALVLILVAAIGCHSPHVAAIITNRTSQPIDLLEVDYPSASFGTQSLAPGAVFHYSFKVLGSGKVSLTYTTGTSRNRKSEGPFLKEGDEGPLQIDVTPDGVRWVRSPEERSPEEH